MTILHIDSSITGENSVSRVLSKRIVEQLTAAQPRADVTHRDLVAEPLDHLTLGAFADSSVLDEFLAADTVVIGAPMYNFTLPSQLKAWLDRILVAGRTFRYREDGSPEGLAGPKRVIVALSRGGFYRGDSPAAGLEHLETYLTGTFGFIGIVPEFVAADGIAVGPEQREASVANALGEVERLAA
ncbi:MAG: FMN-dependent NADH-azoreductase [uncultured Sphingomonas sp.]|uniref:FMN dependent NADH:quinone oxidoreductase n=1 Tax=uncultured Sphingomonas sp. TaxID=158754 RepID=A0A6J4SDD6_9SPHN|nr:NAD(P)H-dependent oxidoreductase [uncultured Sphingomonas sp.]CAA9496203.1 MAG: FMN-dependent NADH-azoreductase [uncultured Sphingomonas sp.]